MHLPIRVDYGVRALLDLAQHQGMQPVHSADIAHRQGIPEAYLARLLLALSKEGFVRSTTGPQGGHVLAQPPASISVGMVMRALGGVEPVVSCLEDPASCSHTPACAQRDVWRSVEEAINAILDRTTIADLLQRTAAA
jgi:Rrf2 family protein